MTKHDATCRMAFGRPHPETGCPRCAELAAGATPRQGWGQRRREMDAQRMREIRAHDCRLNGCGPVCTFGDY